MGAKIQVYSETGDTRQLPKQKNRQEQSPDGLVVHKQHSLTSSVTDHRLSDYQLNLPLWKPATDRILPGSPR